jgi:hypothetical protein
MAHCFDSRVDRVYDVENHEVYLSDEQIQEAIKDIPCETNKDMQAQKFIRMIESARQKMCLGELPLAEYRKICKEANEEFRVAFDVWIYQSTFARSFYKKFGIEES